MNAKQRFMDVLEQKPVDRAPLAAVVTAVTVPMMEKTGVFYPDAHHKSDDLSKLAASVWEHANIECIKLPFGMTVEAEALGAPMEWGSKDTLPNEYPIFDHPDELKIPDNFFDLKRVPVVLEAISQLRKQYDTEVAVVSSIVGPFTLGAKLFGFDNFFPWLITNPDYVTQAMEKLTKLSIEYANAQLEAGADTILIGEAVCSGDLISPDTYRDFIASRHTELTNGIKGPIIQHICGNATRHVEHIAATGAAGYNFDEGADIDVIREHCKGNVAIIGYVPTVEVLLQGTPDDVYQASLECLANGVDMLAPGCSIPQHVTFENIAAMHKALEDWGKSEALRESTMSIVEEKRAKKLEAKAAAGGRRGKRTSGRRRASA